MSVKNDIPGALRFYMKELGKTEEEALTRAGRNTSFKMTGAKFTKAATLKSIKKHKPRRRWSGVRPGDDERLFYALLQDSHGEGKRKHSKYLSKKYRGKKPSNENADSLLTARAQSVRATRASWLGAVEAFGGKPRRKVSAEFKKASDGRKHFKGASLSKAVEILNFYGGAEHNGIDPVKKAMEEVVFRDMLPFAVRRMNRTGRKIS